MLLSFPSFFLAYLFVCALGAALYFFNCPLKNQLISIEKIMCCKCGWYKKYDKKNGGQHHKGLEGLVFRAVASPKPCRVSGVGYYFPNR
jgi:hypothetical protein